MTVKQYVDHTKSLISEICRDSNRQEEKITIVGVTKYVDGPVAEQLVVEGITHLGENRLEKLRDKQEIITDESIKWHFIGSLQTRKVKDVIPHIDYLHSLDRLSLAVEIQKRATKTLPCFLQVKTSYEESKQGVHVDEVLDLVKELKDFDKISIIGLMTMAPLTENKEEIRDCFKKLRHLSQEVQGLNQSNAPCTELSMGMSGDFQIAIEEGATYLRLGSILFGQ